MKDSLENSHNHCSQASSRRQRHHELLIALIQKQDELELLDTEAPTFDSSRTALIGDDPARWLDRNKRILNKYQALVRSAITLDALLESEESGTS